MFKANTGFASHNWKRFRVTFDCFADGPADAVHERRDLIRLPHIETTADHIPGKGFDVLGAKKRTAMAGT